MGKRNGNANHIITSAVTRALVAFLARVVLYCTYAGGKRDKKLHQHA